MVVAWLQNQMRSPQKQEQWAIKKTAKVQRKQGRLSASDEQILIRHVQVCTPRSKRRSLHILTKQIKQPRLEFKQGCQEATKDTNYKVYLMLVTWDSSDLSLYIHAARPGEMLGKQVWKGHKFNKNGGWRWRIFPPCYACVPPVWSDVW